MMELGPRIVLVVVCAVCGGAEAIGEVIYAVNAGGDVHIDVYGVRYEKDPLAGRVGTASDFGKQLIIGRVPPGDQILYQTERYHYSSFGYEIPIKGDGDYVLVLKFSEVYFNSPDQKVFDVQLNGEHLVIPGLDIFSRVGRGVAYDEYVPFTISNNRLLVEGQESAVRDNKVPVEFIKGYRDNPKINAIYVIKGKLEDVPKLPPLPEEDLDVEREEQPRPVHNQKQNGLTNGGKEMVPHEHCSNPIH
ncbi:malectin isoform X2 [Oratosquilla oratoria]|uniref:malectin isoform X2 n=1 Tax=Oratosquilla oratoria TaxID=337810 RepID=UPI003F77247C